MPVHTKPDRPIPTSASLMRPRPISRFAIDLPRAIIAPHRRFLEMFLEAVADTGSEADG